MSNLALDNSTFMTVNEVMENLNVSKPYAYKLMRDLNEELKIKEFITVAGRISRKYFSERFYGLN